MLFSLCIWSVKTPENTLLSSWTSWFPLPCRFSVWSCWYYALRTCRLDADVFWCACRCRLAVIRTVRHLWRLLLSNKFHFFPLSSKEQLWWLHFRAFLCSEAMVRITHSTLNVRIISQSLRNDLSGWSVLWIQALEEANWLHFLQHADFVSRAGYKPRAVNSKISSPAQVFIMSFSRLEDATESHSLLCGFGVITTLCLIFSPCNELYVQRFFYLCTFRFQFMKCNECSVCLLQVCSCLMSGFCAFCLDSKHQQDFSYYKVALEKLYSRPSCWNRARLP